MSETSEFYGDQIEGESEDRLTSLEIEARYRELVADESADSEGVYYLSFAGEDGFHGGCFVLGRGILSATKRATELGINPGGEVMCWGPIEKPEGRDMPMDVLLSKEEVEAL